jgi:thioredoxin-like negative regulator of GroEL
MSPNRREKIEALLADDPGDTFLRYSLALELTKESQSERGLQLLADLMREAPPYVPAFFQSGQILAGLGRTDEARAALRGGIEAARAAGDAHAAGEMGEFLASLGNAAPRV